MPAPELTLPPIFVCNGVLDALVKTRLVSPGLEQARVFTQHIGSGITGQPLECRIDHHNKIMLIADHDRFDRLLEHHLGQTLIGLMLCALDRNCRQGCRLP